MTTSDDSPRRPLVVLEGVNKHFGSLHVLVDIDLEIERGEVVVVLGPSGSGKSTLCRIINRLETIDSGRVLLDGVPLPEEGKELAALRSDVGMVFQSFNLFAHKTVLENVMLGPVKVRRQSRAEAERRARIGWASPARPTSCRPTSPAGSSSGRPSPGPWRWTRRSSCSTNRRRPSIRR